MYKSIKSIVFALTLLCGAFSRQEPALGQSAASKPAKMPISDFYVQKLADSIYRLEGGDKTRYPYGIKSIVTKDKNDARRICLNTIRNNWLRWEKGGRKGNYLDFLANVYCPLSDDPVGHANWVRNVHKLMGE